MYNFAKMRPPTLKPGRLISLLIITGILLSACGNDLWGTYDPYLTPSPSITLKMPDSTGTGESEPLPSQTPTPTLTKTATLPFPIQPTPTATLPVAALTPTATLLTIVPGGNIFYNAQSGDSLNVVAISAS